MTTATIDSIEAAQNKIASIQERLINGDLKVKATDLAQARADLEFAELRQAAQAERQRKAEQERRREYLETKRESLLKIGEQQSVNESRTRFVEALETFCREIDAHNKSVADFRGELNGEGFYSDKTFPGLETDTGVVVRVGDANAQPVDPLRAVRSETDALLRKYFLREFGRPDAWR